MIIGLLEAETLSERVAARYGSYGDMFAALLKPLSPQLQFRYYAVDQGQLPHRVGECDAYIVTGSRHNAYDSDPWIEALKNFIREAHHRRSKCVGICFGHQVMAQALGGQVAKSDKGWGVGVARFSVCERPSWIKAAPDSFNVLVSHQDQVESLPEAATLFARSDFCPRGGYFIDNHIFCLQGHPEFPRDYVQFLVEKRRRHIGEPRASRALESLELPLEPDLYRGWLDDFFSA